MKLFNFSVDAQQRRLQGRKKGKDWDSATVGESSSAGASPTDDSKEVATKRASKRLSGTLKNVVGRRSSDSKVPTTELVPGESSSAGATTSSLKNDSKEVATKRASKRLSGTLKNMVGRRSSDSSKAPSAFLASVELGRRHSCDSNDGNSTTQFSVDGTTTVEKVVLGNRYSLGRGKAEKKVIAVTVDNNDTTVCNIEVRPNITIIKARVRIEREGDEDRNLPRSFRFRYSDGTLVDVDNEGITRLQSCLSSDGKLCIFSQRALLKEEVLCFCPSSAQLASISDNAEAVVRYCLRLLESFQADKRTSRGVSVYLPSPLPCCLLFLRDVARATIDASAGKIVWQTILAGLHDIEKCLQVNLRHPKFIALMSYRSDLAGLSESVKEIQNELHGKVSDDHPVFYVKIDRPSQSVEVIINILADTNFMDLCGERHSTTRSKMAEILNMNELQVIECIKNKGSSAALHERGMFRDVQTLAKQSSQHTILDNCTLKEVFAPQVELQEAWLQQKASNYHQATFHWAMDAYDQWAGDIESPHRCFLLTGKEASGKSTFLSQLINARTEVVACHVSRHDDLVSTDAKAMLLSIVYQLCIYNASFEKKIRSIMIAGKVERCDLMSSSYPLGQVFREFLAEPLKTLKIEANKSYCIAIDGIELGHEERDSILNVLRTMLISLPSWLRFVVTTRPFVSVLKRLRAFNAKMVETNSKDVQKDFSAYFYDRLSARQHGDGSESRLIAEDLANNSKGNFLFASIIGSKLQEMGYQDILQEYTNLDFDTILRKDLSLVQNFNDELFWDVVQISLVSFHALSISDIVALTGCLEEQMNHLLDISRTFFVVTTGHIVRFSHQSTKHWLLARILVKKHDGDSPKTFKSLSGSALASRFKDEFKSCHERFATQILRVLLICRHDTRFNFVSNSIKNYVLKFGCNHMVSGGLAKEAAATVLDPLWIMARASDAEGLISDCKLVEDQNDAIQLLRRAILLSLPALKKDHRQIAGQLVGRLKAATIDGHHGNDIQQKVSDLVNNLEGHDYGFQWWCPVAATWDQAEQTMVRKIAAHQDQVQSVVLHPSNIFCASGSWDTQIYIWNIITGSNAMRLSGHEGAVMAVDWSSTGDRILSASSDRTARIWNYPSGKQEMVLRGHTDFVFTAKFSIDSKLVATGSRDGTIKIWSATSGECVETINAHDGFVYSVDWKPNCNNRFICSGGTDNAIRVWDLEKGGRNSLSCFGHTDWVRCVVWSVGGHSILSGSSDKTVICWDSETAECEQVLMGHKGGIWSVVQSKDSRYVFTSSVDGSVKIWESSTWRCDQTLCGHSGPVLSICVTSDGSKAMSGGADSCVIEWDCEVERTVSDLDDHTKPIWGIDVSPDGTQILSASTDNTARLWNVVDGLAERVFAGHTGPVWACKFDHGGRKIATASSDGTAAIYRVSTGGRSLELPHGDGVWDVAWSKDDKFLFTAARDNVIRQWNARTGICQVVYQGHSKDVKSIAISEDGKRMASASNDGTIMVWDLFTHSTTQTLFRNKEDGVVSVAWCPDNICVAAGYASGSVRLWNANTGSEAASFLPGHNRRANAVSCCPDGKFVVSASTDKEIRVWNIAKEQCERRITAGLGLGVFCVKHIDNGHIVSGGADRTVRIWNTSNGNCETVMAGVTGLGIYDVAFSPNEDWVASGSRDRTVQIWDSASGKCIKTLKGHTNWVHSVDWEEGGKRVVSISDDGTSRIWNVCTGECEEIFYSKKIPATFKVGSAPSICADLSRHADEGNPIGIQCDKVKVCGDRACGWIGKNVFFFTLRQSDQFAKSMAECSPEEWMIECSSNNRLDLALSSSSLPTARVERRQSMGPSFA